MEVRAKKALGQHFLTDLSIAQKIADALETEESTVAHPGDRTGNGGFVAIPSGEKGH